MHTRLPPIWSAQSHCDLKMFLTCSHLAVTCVFPWDFFLYGLFLVVSDSKDFFMVETKFWKMYLARYCTDCGLNSIKISFARFNLLQLIEWYYQAFIPSCYCCEDLNETRMSGGSSGLPGYQPGYLNMFQLPVRLGLGTECGCGSCVF